MQVCWLDQLGPPSCFTPDTEPIPGRMPTRAPPSALTHLSAARSPRPPGARRGHRRLPPAPARSTRRHRPATARRPRQSRKSPRRRRALPTGHHGRRRPPVRVAGAQPRSWQAGHARGFAAAGVSLQSSTITVRVPAPGALRISILPPNAATRCRLPSSPKWPSRRPRPSPVGHLCDGLRDVRIILVLPARLPLDARPADWTCCYF